MTWILTRIDSTLGTPCKGVIDRLLTTPGRYGCDGEHGKGALIAADGAVYDVTESRMWKGGLHAMRHKAGEDLTEYLKDAPHDKSVLERVKKVGVLTTGPATVPTVVKLFTVNAYFNLTSCFLIILVLVLL